MNAAAALCVLLIAAGAQEERAAKQKAGKLLEQGNTLFEAKKYREALEKYDDAYAAFPSPKIFFNQAEAHAALGQPVTAANLYERMLLESGLDAKNDLYQRSAAALAALDAKLCKFAARGTPEGADILLDGTAIGKIPMEATRVLAGPHKIRVEKSGFTPLEKSLELPAGKTETLAVELAEVKIDPPQPEPAAPPPVARVETPPPEPEQDSILSTWWFWTAIGLVIATGAGIGVAAASGGDDFVPSGELGRSSLDGDWRRL